MSLQKRYLGIIAQKPSVLAALRSFLKNDLDLDTHTNLSQEEKVAGVQYREYMEYQDYPTPDGVVHLYSVLAGKGDTYFQMITVFIDLPEDLSVKILRFLDAHQFVASFDGLTERPAGGERVFRGYLEKPPRLCAILNEFYEKSSAANA